MAKNRIVVAKHDEAHQCLAADGEWLIAANPEVKPPIKVKDTDHFFVGLETGLPSLYGWIEESEAEVDVEKVVEMVLNSPAEASVGATIEAIRDQVSLTLHSIRNVPLGAPVVSDFTRKSFKDHTLIQKVHRVFFRKT